MVIFHSYVKLPEGSHQKTTSLIIHKHSHDWRNNEGRKISHPQSFL